MASPTAGRCPNARWRARGPWRAACRASAARRPPSPLRPCGCSGIGVARRRCPGGRYQGSFARYRPLAISSQRIACEPRPRARVQADTNTTFSSRTTGAPCHSATPIQRGRPRLPVPAIRRAVHMVEPRLRHRLGESPSIGRRRGRARAASILFQNLARCLSETTSSSRNQAQSRSSTIGLGVLQPLGVAVEDGRAHLGRRAPRPGVGQQGARRQPDEVQRIGHLRRLVEIVDAPDQAAVGVAPGAEILQMDIADGENGGRVCQVRTGLEDRLGPSPIGGAKKDEGALPHLLVLERDIFRDDLPPKLFSQPIFIGLHGFADVGHGHASRRLRFLHLYDAIDGLPSISLT